MNKHARCSTLLQRLALAGTLLLSSIARGQQPPGGGRRVADHRLCDHAPKLIKDEAQIHILPTPMRVGSGQGVGLVETF